MADGMTPFANKHGHTKLTLSEWKYMKYSNCENCEVKCYLEIDIVVNSAMSLN